MEELKILNQAIDITNKMLKQNGEADIVGYLRTGNTKVFTRDKGVRQAVEEIPFKDMEKVVKKAFIDETIGYFGAPQQFDSKNEIVEIIESWIRWKFITESETDFNKTYELIIKNHDANKLINSVLAEAEHKYYWAKLQLERKHLPDPIICELINLLEFEKQKMSLEKVNNRF